MISPSKGNKTRGVLITGVALAGVIGYVVGIFLPGQKSIANKRKELLGKKQFIVNAELNTVAAEALEKELKDARLHVQRWREHASTESGGVALLGDLAGLAAGSGVALHRLAPQEPSTLNTLRQQTLDLEVEGTFASVIQFLHEMEARPESIWVPQMDLQPSPEDALMVQCTVSLVVFADNRGNSG
jgi:Tfp pilus assembly protein PilO